MIPKKYIKLFMDRKRKDFRSYKQLRGESLKRAMQRLPVRPPIWNKLSREQKICLVIGAQERRFGFYLDTGMGKTLLSIALALYFRKLEQRPLRFLVLVPNRSNKAEWAREVRKHCKSMTTLVLSGSTEQKLKALDDPANADKAIVVETYAGWMRMCSILKEVMVCKRKKNKLILNASRIRKFVKLFDGVILDESIKAQNKKSLAFRAARQMAKKLDLILFELNGTPFGRDPEPVWGQMFLLDGGHSLGQTLGLYRAAFYNEKINYFGGHEYKFRDAMKSRLHDFLAHKTIEFEMDESDRPRTIPIERIIRLPTDAESYAAAAEKELIANQGNYIASKNAFMRMRQISSGWIGYKDDETGEKAAFEFSRNPKLDDLMSVIETIDQKHKAIIFHDFIFSGHMIAKRLKAAKIKFARIYGGTKDSELAKALHDFDHDPECRIMLLNNQAGGYGLNLQVARYGLHYESPPSPIIRLQTERRYQRQHSKHKMVMQYDFLVAGTYDRTIREWHREGAEMLEAVLRGRGAKRPGKGGIRRR